MKPAREPGQPPRRPWKPQPFGILLTPEEAAAAVPGFDPALLRYLLATLHVPEAAPGRWDAADLYGLHDALGPWLRRA